MCVWRCRLVYHPRMHVRFSMCLGMPLVDDHNDDLLATVSGVFLHPDLGKVEGLFVHTERGEEFLATSDIAHWGRSIVVRDPDAVAPLEERVRLSALWEEGRPVLGQKIVTESSRMIGTCTDVQFETDTFRLEWLFPRRMFRWKQSIPVGAIIEVRPDAVRIRDMEVPVGALPADPTMNPLDAIGAAGLTVREI